MFLKVGGVVVDCGGGGGGVVGVGGDVVDVDVCFCLWGSKDMEEERR